MKVSSTCVSDAESHSLVMRAKAMRWGQSRTWGKEEKRAKMLKGVGKMWKKQNSYRAEEGRMGLV